MDAISARIASANAAPSARAFLASASSRARSLSSKFITRTFARASEVSRRASMRSVWSISMASTSARIASFATRRASISARVSPSRSLTKRATARLTFSGARAASPSTLAFFSKSPIKPEICASSSSSVRANAPAMASGALPLPVTRVKFSTSRRRNASRPLAVMKAPPSLLA